MTDRFDPATHPQRRRNPLTGDWVVVSPQRTKRPWQGQTGERSNGADPTYDPSCYLCPGNERAGGVQNPDYATTYVFENDFAALLPNAPSPRNDNGATALDAQLDERLDERLDELFEIAHADGECRVICFSPRHDLTLARMSAAEIGVVIDLWRDQYGELADSWEWVQLFETRGAISGASNPHPHGQIWSSNFLPNEIATETSQQGEYWSRHGSPMLLDYAEREVASGERAVTANDAWVAVVPFWAYWPYETLVLPRRPLTSFADLDRDDADALADVLGRMLRAFDRLFDVAFPYCSGWHGTPRSGGDGVQLHAHYYPPLLRSADVAKIPASYELLANVQRDLTPETAAAHLRSVLD